MYNSTSSTDQISYCPSCGTMLEWDNEIGGYKCTICGYSERTVIGDPKTFCFKDGSVAKAVDPEPLTLHILNCKTVKFDVNGITITADFGDVDLSKYEAIEINGYRFERAVKDTRTPYERLRDTLDELSLKLNPTVSNFVKESQQLSTNISAYCLNCPTHPRDGESGNCNCILGTPAITY